MTIPCHINNQPIVEARVKLPLIGAWHADVVLASETTLSGAVTIELFGEQFVGTVLRSTVIGGQVRVRIVGGAGGLTTELQPRHWSSGSGLVTARKVLLEALDAGGETLSDDSDTAMLATSLASWQRQGGPVSRSIQAVADSVGASWRVLANGEVWLGPETWGEADPEHVLIDEDWDAGVIEIAPESPTLVPGVTFRGQQIRYVVHSISKGATRTEACLDSPGGLLDRFLAGVRQEIRYSGAWVARVTSQNSDGTLEVMPYHASFQGRGLSKVPIRHGLPGFVVKVTKGAKIRLQFDDGDPSKPFASLWDEGESSVTEIEYKPGGIGRPAVRVGETLECVIPAGALLMTSAGPASFVAPTPLTAVIMGPGNSKFKL